MQAESLFMIYRKFSSWQGSGAGAGAGAGAGQLSRMVQSFLPSISQGQPLRSLLHPCGPYRRGSTLYAKSLLHPTRAEPDTNQVTRNYFTCRVKAHELLPSAVENRQLPPVGSTTRMTSAIWTQGKTIRVHWNRKSQTHNGSVSRPRWKLITDEFSGFLLFSLPLWSAGCQSRWLLRSTTNSSCRLMFMSPWSQSPG